MPLPPRAPGSPDHDLRTSPPAVRRSLIPWSLRFVLAATVSDARGSRVLLRHGLGGTKPARRHRTTGGDFYTTRVGSERAHALLRQPRHGSRTWYCPFTLASGSDPRHTGKPKNATPLPRKPGVTYPARREGADRAGESDRADATAFPRARGARLRGAHRRRIRRASLHLRAARASHPAARDRTPAGRPRARRSRGVP